MRNLAAGSSRNHAEEIVRDADVRKRTRPLESMARRRHVARVRWLMIISGLTTLIAHRRGHRRHRLSRFPRRAEAPRRPSTRSSRCRRARASSSTTVAGDRVAVTIDIGGAIEMRTFDVKTLRADRTAQVCHRALKPRRRENERACTCAPSGLFRKSGSLRLAAQDVALSRRKQGFESPRERQ